jgi:polyketide synthase PksN
MVATPEQLTMTSERLLQEVTESYLTSIVDDVRGIEAARLDALAPFGEQGVDSFLVLKIIRRLEQDFGLLPKTLLFEHFNISELASFFVRKHRPTLSRKFADRLRNGAAAEGEVVRLAKREPARDACEQERSCEAIANRDDAMVLAPGPILILEKDAAVHPELASVVDELFRSYKNEGSVSRGTRHIAPNLFIGIERRGYFNYCRSKDIILVYCYTGPDEYFMALAEQIYRHCARNNLQLNIFADRVVESIGEVAFTSTPFGVIQRILDLGKFSLEGGAMRRLRYQVSKFEKSGHCRTTEYRCGAQPQVDRDIGQIIDSWCSKKTMVNPLVYAVKEEILRGTLSAPHRIFLTYVDAVLQNVILITAMAGRENGYLMDLEFYTSEMPLGGLEFAIVRIIEKLVTEGASVFSLGGTYGCRLETSANADPEITRVIDDLQKQDIFNDQGNLQFKNKFRPESRTIYLCREAGSGRADNVVDIIMLIADPAKMQTSDEEHHNGRRTDQPVQFPSTAPPNVAERSLHVGAMVWPIDEISPRRSGSTEDSATQRIPLGVQDRAHLLAEHGFNPINVPSEHVEFDLKTDSWAQLSMRAIESHVRHLHTQLPRSVAVEDAVRAIFPFSHVLLTASGRAAEHVLYKAWPRKGVVLQNLLFPTGIYHQIDKGFDPREVPHQAAFDLASQQYLLKGQLDLEAVGKELDANASAVALVCVEVNNNAAGGYPVSMTHLRELRALLSRHSIPLVLDCTRVVENAQFLIEREKDGASKSVWTVVRDMVSLADVVVASLAKDFCINKGGLIATNDSDLFRGVAQVMQAEGDGLGALERKLLAVALEDRQRIEAQVVRRMRVAKYLSQSLAERGIPVVQPAGGHCVLLDVKRVPQFGSFECPVASCLAWIFLNTGIRAGAHSVGMQKSTSLNDLIRLAIPIGLTRSQIEEVGARLIRLFESGANIPDLAANRQTAGPPDSIHAQYNLKQYHNPVKAAEVEPPSLISDAGMARPTAKASPKAPNKPVDNPSIQSVQAIPRSVHVKGRAETPNRAEDGLHHRQDIAVIGMAGRYPKAKNMEELWDLLSQGRDCIEEIPAQRYEQRLQYEDVDKYRGGFIEDVDRFDSLFFNISPREAQMLDPQERLFLEVAWEAVEEAGYYPEILVGETEARNIGVFVGAVWAMYQMIGVEERRCGGKVSPNSFLWSIANRVSYWMNLSGPSLTLDTACSSSLTAIYLACEAIYKGECSAAIVGGVNLDLHQGKLDINLVGGALSKDGVCRTFGENANGYVAGEGVGAVLIKPLERALRDGDHIHGVIKSVTVNHGGRTSGFTVPNPKAQSNVVECALRQAGIDARSVGYVEAHGTGTELGDPIEITGLTGAFEGYGVATQSCAIGSIKTNIGHLEAAAGIVGVCKVLLQMKHRRLAPSLHAAQPNRFIDFKSSPFYVVQNLQEWSGKVVAGVVYPLRASVSSFGAGGSNAHVILEDYERPAEPELESSNLATQWLFALSAKTEAQLREVASRFEQHIKRSAAHDECAARQYLRDVSYTLQLGRKSFEHRLAIMAGSREELLEKLSCYLGDVKDAKVISGHAKSHEGIAGLLNGDERDQFISLLLQRRDAYRIAQLWADGILTDWQGVPAQGFWRRVSLPTYPFAQKRHWVRGEPTGTERGGRALRASAAIHPLIDGNESTFERQIFRKSFHRRDFFIHDHRVSNIPTLPGVAYLEFARKAGELAAGRRVQKIRNVIWISPIVVQGSEVKEVFIELKPTGDAVQFEVFSADAKGERTLHSQGKIIYAPKQDRAAEPEFIDVEAIRARCQKVTEGYAVYPLFKSFGLDLGPSFQVLGDIYKNGTETLGVLSLPASREADLEDLVLHPSLIDGSLQAGMGAQLGGTSVEMLVPFSIGEVEILHPLQPNCFSYVTAAKSDRAGSSVVKSNVVVADAAGKVLVKIKESSGVPLREIHRNAIAPADGGEFARLYYAYEWEKTAAAVQTRDEAHPGSVVFFETGDVLRSAYRERAAGAGDSASQGILVQSGDRFEEMPDWHYKVNPSNPDDFSKLFESLATRACSVGRICFAWPVAESPEALDDEAAALQESLGKGVYAFLFLCQAILKRKRDRDTRVLYLSVSESLGSRPQNDAIGGFIKALRLEHSKFVCKSLEIQQGTCINGDSLGAVLAELGCDIQGECSVRYHGNERFVRTLKAFEFSSVETEAPAPAVTLRKNGVYLITGGAGGLGLIFAEFLAKEYQARLLLTGRSTLSPQLAAALAALGACGGEAIYCQADVSNIDDVRSLIERCKSHFGAINGVIHAAGVLRDSYVRNKTAAEMQAVFAPKIDGTLHLDAATRQEALDVFVLFSSLAAVAGNAGQCDYGFANHFMDSFAARRELLRQTGARSGKTLSINWSLWADGGMKLDAQTELFFRKNLGIKPLSKGTGLQALKIGLASSRSQFAVLEAVREKIEIAWGLRAKAPVVVARPVEADAAAAHTTADRALPHGASGRDVEGDLLVSVQDELSKIVMNFLKLEANDVSHDKILLDLGFDSLGLTTFANAVNEKYQLDITPVLFFDFPSISEIAKYLCTERQSEMRNYHRNAATPAKAVDDKGHGPKQPVTQGDVDGLRPGAMPTFEWKKQWDVDAIDRQQKIAQSSDLLSPELRFVNKPIAIVGMSGVMPQSETLDEFWANLRDARDLVTVIPESRWNWMEYYGDTFRQANKSNSKWGGFMKEVDKFDPLFFGISPREAHMMDPQQRMFLEAVWKAVEDSGHRLAELSGTKTGLFVGVAPHDYSDLMNKLDIGLDGYTASGNSHSVLANRISFLLNLRGPSAPLDTACSSSLVALHRAIESIHTGSCDRAIVGGVQVMLTPAAHISFGMAGMLSDDGKCKSFDKRANGYVRGEGVGAILIKPLAMAEADHDSIYAIVKATAENHGGRVTTLTAPNATAQAELLIEAYQKAQVDPGTVGYIECHGTGTSLGDPIEIQGLSRAFSELYKRHGREPAKTPHCGLSSVKTNIGHLECAAGIAGILKVLLAIRNRQIPANIHFEALNPYINLKGTPFYIVDKTTQWPMPKADDGSDLPRRAGVSSFGFGGANAHVVLEEYLPTGKQGSVRQPQRLLFILSARNVERLKSYARSILLHIETNDVDPIDFAYTLQVGRDAMAARLAFAAGSVAEIADILRAYVAGESEIEGVHQGYVGGGKQKAEGAGRSPLNAKEAVERQIASAELDDLLEAWAGGAEVDWNKLYGDDRPNRIRLPTYPFARERYWIDTARAGSVAPQSLATTCLHPLLHANVSDFFQQSYSSTFSGDEFFLSAHLVKGQRVLPGVAYLEMARAAVDLALRDRSESAVMELRNTVWLQPMIAAGRTQVATTLHANDDGRIDYEIHSAQTTGEVIHCRGTAVCVARAPVGNIDIPGLQAKMEFGPLDPRVLYAAFARMGITYGLAHQGVKSLYRGRRQVLAQLVLPACVDNTQADYVLHPSMLDSALQASLGLVASLDELPSRPSLPFALDCLRVFSGCTKELYAWVRVSGDSGDSAGRGESPSELTKTDIDLFDDRGTVCVQMHGLASRVLDEKSVEREAAPELEIAPRQLVFSEDMPLVKDHRIDGTSVLIGAVYLSLMLKAAKDLVPRGDISIDNVAYLNPVRIESGESVNVVLEGSRILRQVHFSVACTKHDNANPIPAAKGTLNVTPTLLSGTASFDELEGQSIAKRNAGAFYQHPNANIYGSSQFTVQEVYTLVEESKVVGKIRLTDVMARELPSYAVHPCILDALFVTALFSLATNVEDLPQQRCLPALFDSVKISGELSQFQEREYFCVVAKTLHNKNIAKMDIQLYAMSGRLLCSINGFTVQFAARREPMLQILAPIWRALPVEAAQPEIDRTARVLLLGSDATHLEWLRASYVGAQFVHLPTSAEIGAVAAAIKGYSFDQLIWIAPDVGGGAGHAGTAAPIIEAQDQGVLAAFRVTKSLLLLGYANKELRWTLITANTQAVKQGGAICPRHAAISGFVGSLAKEFPRWQLRLVDVDSLESISAHQCLSLPRSKQGDGVAYREGECFQQELARMSCVAESAPSYRQHGVYVVIGGAGGLGEVWTRFMIERFQACIVWIGRRKRNAAIEAKIDALSRIGPAPMYLSADATRLEELQGALATILTTHPRIHGVVHSAIVLHDQGVANMEEAEFRSSLAAKVDVSVHMNSVFGMLDLDFMLFFSSLVSFVKTPGQSNYSAGCTFKDSFALSLQPRRPYPIKIMNWGFWGNVGVVANESYKSAMRRLGVDSIEPEEGMRLLQGLVGSQTQQLVVLKTFGGESAIGLNVTEEVVQYVEVIPDALPDVVSALEKQVSAEQLSALQSELPSDEIVDVVVAILAANLECLELLGHGVGNDAYKMAGQFYDRWLSRAIGFLQERGVLDGERRIVRQLPRLGELWAGWEKNKSAWARNSNLRAQIQLLETCLKALPGVLSGKQRATEVMFPGSSMHLVDGIYKGNVLADYYNGVLVKTLGAYIDRRRDANPDCEIRILEIGAGTGGTTEGLLPLLQNAQVAEYCYTDVSKAFLMHADECYRPRCRALSTALFDVTKPLAVQGMAADRYDVAIAANVLHATPNVRETVRNAKACLRRHGILLLNEISSWSLFNHLTFGLLEGWWLHADTPLRLPGCPGLAPARWEELLRAEGFRSIGFPASSTHEFGQQIIVASSDGAARQRWSRQPADLPPRRERPADIRAEISGMDSKRSRVIADSSETAKPGCDDRVQKVVTEKVSEALRMTVGAVQSDTAFADYGVDSIIGVNLVRSINEALQIELATTSLFEHSTVDQLTEHIRSRWGERLAGRAAMSNEYPPGSSASGEIPNAQFVLGVHARAIKSRPRGAFAAAPTVDAAGRVGSAERIAIIGMSGRFAQSESLDEFWRNLEGGNDLVKEVSRWNARDCVISDPGSHGYCSRGSFIESIDLFDPAFFRISAQEALYMDPQQRLFLEESWKALEDAGYVSGKTHENRCGVYVGCGSSNYDRLFLDEPPPHAFWGNSESVIPARVAYYLDLRGPAMAVDTACSSSLVAIHLACQSLWADEIEMALAGGVFLQSTSNFYQVANRAGMLSRTGKCRSFDAGADGFVPGEGVGVIVLKRLTDALKAGDPIHGVIVGSGTNQDGSSNGLTAPSARAQESLERAVYDRFKINPESIQVVEAHGTGTPLGDSIEFEAISRVFREHTDKRGFCALGTVKTNIGHAATAAGVAGVLKLLLSLKHRRIPPSLHFETANSLVNLESSSFYVNTELREWRVEPGQVRRAAISAFGFSGTNAHVVIEEAPPVEPSAVRAPGYIVALSARTAAQLQQQAANLLAFVRRSPILSMNDLSHSLLVARSHFVHRFACVVRDQQELVLTLERWIDTGTAANTYASEVHEADVRSKASLTKFGNHCIGQCRSDVEPAGYLECLATVADLYSQGFPLEFHTLFPPGSRRISLPTYPFARERYWIGNVVRPQAQTVTIAPANREESTPHPLLQRNTSDEDQISFASVFSGSELIFAGYPVRRTDRPERNILPSIMCLEMGRAAISHGVPAGRGPLNVELRNVVWGPPVAAGANRPVTTMVFTDVERFSFEVVSAQPVHDGRQREMVHCHGNAAFVGAEDVPSHCDYERLKATMALGKMDPDALYRAFARMGMNYGGNYRAIANILLGERQRLVRVSLPDAQLPGYPTCVLHPLLMESAMQAAASLITDFDHLPKRASFPVGLRSLRSFPGCAGDRFLWVRYGNGCDQSDETLTLDVDMFDRSGRICAAFRSLEFFNEGYEARSRVRSFPREVYEVT